MRLLIRNFKGGSTTDTILQRWHFFSNISNINIIYILYIYIYLYIIYINIIYINISNINLNFWWTKKNRAGVKQYEIKALFLLLKWLCFTVATKEPKRMKVKAIFKELKGTIGVGLLTKNNVLAYSQCIWGGGVAVWFKSKKTYWRVCANL